MALQERAHEIGFFVIIKCWYAFSYNVMNIKNHYNENPGIFALYIYLV